VLRDLWNRWLGRSDEEAAERLSEEQQMSPGERAFIEERPEDRRDDVQTEAILGGVDPNRLLGD
jgi:hypothetical protein